MRLISGVRSIPVDAQLRISMKIALGLAFLASSSFIEKTTLGSSFLIDSFFLSDAFAEDSVYHADSRNENPASSEISGYIVKDSVDSRSRATSMNDKSKNSQDVRKSGTGSLLAKPYGNKVIKGAVVGDLDAYYVTGQNDEDFKVGRYYRENYMATHYSFGVKAEASPAPEIVVGAQVVMRASRDKKEEVSVHDSSLDLVAKTAALDITPSAGGSVSLSLDSASRATTIGTLSDVPVTGGTGFSVAGADLKTGLDSKISLPTTLAGTLNATTGSSISGGETVTEVSVQDAGKVTVTSVHLYKANVFVDSPFGRLEFGTMDGPASKLFADAASITRGGRGIDGNWHLYANMKGDTIRSPVNGKSANPDYYSAPASYSSFYLQNPPRVAYYTPNVGGLTVGFGYEVDQGDDSSQSRFSQRNNNDDYRNVISGGLLYDLPVKGLNFTVSVTGEYGRHEEICLDPVRGKLCTQNYEKLKAYHVGGVIGAGGFSVAGGYGYLGKSGHRLDFDINTNYVLTDQNRSERARFSALLGRPYPVTAGATLLADQKEWYRSTVNLLAKDHYSSSTAFAKPGELVLTAYKAGQTDLSNANGDDFNELIKVIDALDRSVTYEGAGDPADYEKTEYWNVGASFEAGPAGVSVVYMDSRTGQRDWIGGRSKLKLLSAGADYQLANGFSPYIEFVKFKLEDDTFLSIDTSDLSFTTSGALRCGSGGSCDKNDLYETSLFKLEGVGQSIYEKSSLPNNTNKGYVVMIGLKMNF